LQFIDGIFMAFQALSREVDVFLVVQPATGRQIIDIPGRGAASIGRYLQMHWKATSEIERNAKGN
jgi:hypothetical protein